MKLRAIPIVTKHINQWDPLGLLAIGAPDDEYKPEIEEIAIFFVDNQDLVTIAEDIQKTFDDITPQRLSFEACLSVTEKVWAELYE